MQINFTGLGVDVTPALREFTNNKFERIQRHFDKITSIKVSFDIENLQQVASATVFVPNAELHARSQSKDMYSSIDTLVDKIDQQIKKHKEKLKDHRD